MLPMLANMFFKPKTPIRIPNDDTSFNTKEYPNITFFAQGNLTGNVKIVHDSTVDLGLISTRLWVHNEKDAEKIIITPSFDSRTCSVTLTTNISTFSPPIYHETMVRIPTTTTQLENMYVEAPNTSLFGDLLDNLKFFAFTTHTSNASVDLKPLHALEEVDIHTSNGHIAGVFESSKITLNTTNGGISAVIKALASSLHSGVTPITLQSGNGTIDVHLDASQAQHGLGLKTHTTNAKITMGILLGQDVTNPSSLAISSSNGKLEINIDAAKLGNALGIQTSTTNGSITQSIMVPPRQPFHTSAKSSNGSLNINLTNDFEGTFDLATSNGSVNVEGSDVRYSHEKKSNKAGHRGQTSYGSVSAKTSNSSVNLRFYPNGGKSY